jgi:hypothetical protein
MGKHGREILIEAAHKKRENIDKISGSYLEFGQI